MPQQDISSAITQIKKTQENFKVGVGILAGTILIIYFFTYGALVDAKSRSLIWFEVITSVMMLFVLLFLRRVCFFLTRIKLGRKTEYRIVFANIHASDLALDDQAIAEKLK